MRTTALALALSFLMAAPIVWPAAVRSATELRAGCRGPSNSVAIADDLLANRYTLAGYPTVTLPANPTWAENPLHQVNWLFNYHSLRFVWALTTAWAETGDQQYLDRASFLLHDWYRDNPRSSPPSIWSWNDHGTAWRAMVFVCAAEIMPRSTWLTGALALHGKTLADPAFYRVDGNHALNQDVGLLELACFLGRTDWMRTASRRVSSLVSRSVDSAGATNEQAVFYELYNYNRYRYAETRFAECGQPIGSAFARIDRMPTFLAHATLPDGTYVPLGDTQGKASPIRGTPAEFAATLGASGPKPSSTSRVYGAGFAFARTGWGETRPYADETMMSVRFGPARRFHGHNDGSSVTLYAYGASVLLDSGMYSINPSAYRRYFVGRSAHNLVTVDHARSTPSATRIVWKRSSSTMFELAMSGHPYAGVVARRRVTFSRAMGYAVVDDGLASSTSRTFRQLWHLRERSAPMRKGTRTWTRSARSNVLIIQLIPPTATRIMSGKTAPIQGWISYHRDKLFAAPVVESRRSGASARFLTVLVPFATARPAVAVSEMRLWSGGYEFTVTIDGQSEHVLAGTSVSRITPLSAP